MADTVYILEDQSAIVQDMINYFQNAQTLITDFNEGAEARNLLESVGVSAYQQRYLTDYMMQMGYVHTATGDWLDMIGILVNCTRKQAVQSTGTLVISTPTTKTDDTDIPDGTLFLCSTDSTLYFETIGDSTLPAGQASVTVNAQASLGGSNGNVVAGMIDTFNTPIIDLTVLNPAPFTNGTDVEDDIPFRGRILLAGKGNITGSITWYQSEASSITGVHDAVAINKPLDPGYDLKLLINGDIKPTSSNVISDVLALFEQEDHMIGGVNVLVTSPDFISQDVNVLVLLQSGFTWSLIEPILQSDIECYFNGGTTSYGVEYSGLNGGEGITLAILQTIIINSLGSAFLDYTITSPSANVNITNEQAIMLGNINLSQIGGV